MGRGCAGQGHADLLGANPGTNVPGSFPSTGGDRVKGERSFTAFSKLQSAQSQPILTTVQGHFSGSLSAPAELGDYVHFVGGGPLLLAR